MAIRFVCPFGHPIKAADNRAGKKGRCPVCHQKVIVPVANPRPSGRGKRSWDARGSSQIAPDDDHTPMPPAAASSSLPVGRRKRRLRQASRGSGSATAPPVNPPPIAPPLIAPPPVNAPLPFEQMVQQVLVEREAVVDLGRAARPSLDDSIGDSAAFTPLHQPGRLPSHAPLDRPALFDRPAPPVKVESTPAELKPFSGRRGPQPEPPPRWVGRMRAEWDSHVVRASAEKVTTVHWLAAILSLTVVVGAAPALGHWQLAGAPAWAQVMLLAAGSQLAYTIWLALLPDWSSLRLGTILFGVVAAGYGTVMALVIQPPASMPSPLGLAGADAMAAAWCGANLVVAGLVSFTCARLAAEWRRVGD
jgi:hypothetical protein